MRWLTKCFASMLATLLLAGIVYGVGTTRDWAYSASDLYGSSCIQSYIDVMYNGTAGRIMVFNASGTWGEVAVSGDGTLTTNGVLTITNTASLKLAAAKVLIGDPNGVARAQTIAGDGTVASNGTLTVTNLNNGKLAAAKVLIGNASGVAAAQTLSGDATVNTSGVVVVDSATGDFAVGDDLSVTGKVNITVTTSDLTNNATLTLTDSFYVLTGSGQADNFTNTVTLANPAAIGDVIILTVAGTSSNLITIADSGNANLAGAWLADNYDSITLVAQEAAKWTELSRSDN